MVAQKSGDKAQGKSNGVSFGSIVKNLGLGVVDAGKGAVEGLVNIVAHPIETAKGIGTLAYAYGGGVSNANQTTIQMNLAIGNAALGVYNDFVNGDANVKSRYIGRAVGEIGLAVVGTKGVDKALKAIKVTDKAGEIANVLNKADDIIEGTSSLAKELPVLKNPSSGDNIVYRALNQKDFETINKGLGLEAKNPSGGWNLEQHLKKGSNKLSWQNDPYISTTSDINVARGFNESGSKLGVVEIDLSKVPSAQYKGYEIFPRVNGEAGLPYHYSIWQQETSVFQQIPREAIRGVVK